MAFEAGTTRDGMRLSFHIGRIEYDASRDVTMVYPADNYLYIGSVGIKGKISPEKCRKMFGDNVQELFGKGYDHGKGEKASAG